MPLHVVAYGKVIIVKSSFEGPRIWLFVTVFCCASKLTAIDGAIWFALTPISAQEVAPKTEAPKTSETESEPRVKWNPLDDQWEPCEFGGDGPVELTKGQIEVGYGDPLTGVRWKDSFPNDNYEVELEARRTDGFDFFCALTFPVAKSHCTLVLGGWGGGVTGLSSIDGYDASDNPTTQFRAYDDDKWYRVRVRVMPDKIRCWVDDKEIIDQDRDGHEFDIRFEMDPCVPLGIAAYQCDAEYRKIRWRKLSHDTTQK